MIKFDLVSGGGTPPIKTSTRSLKIFCAVHGFSIMLMRWHSYQWYDNDMMDWSMSSFMPGINYYRAKNNTKTTWFKISGGKKGMTATFFFIFYCYKCYDKLSLFYLHSFLCLIFSRPQKSLFLLRKETLRQWKEFTQSRRDGSQFVHQAHFRSKKSKWTRGHYNSKPMKWWEHSTSINHVVEIFGTFDFPYPGPPSVVTFIK